MKDSEIKKEMGEWAKKENSLMKSVGRNIGASTAKEKAVYQRDYKAKYLKQKQRLLTKKEGK